VGAGGGGGTDVLAMIPGELNVAHKQAKDTAHICWCTPLSILQKNIYSSTYIADDAGPSSEAVLLQQTRQAGGNDGMPAGMLTVAARS